MKGSTRFRGRQVKLTSIRNDEHFGNVLEEALGEWT